ncbi:MAG: helix-turn-helix transcriptional regulator [Minwuia sp.]|uniref:helix-turn-helix transcriptional regulator n=1 Tax=Minwuia sp. TaxID=2493630 RepID=UPI003A8728A4
MTAPRPAARRGLGDRRAALLAGLLTVQALCAVFFVGDVIGDFGSGEIDLHTAFEGLVALMLVIGVVLGGLEMRRTLERNQRAEAALSVASGAFAELIESYFEKWTLTPAEADVAMLALKGFDVAEIAEFRGAAQGTVRAQLTRVYAKAGVSNRTQLVGLFVEELMGGRLREPD